MRLVGIWESMHVAFAVVVIASESTESALVVEYSTFSESAVKRLELSTVLLDVTHWRPSNQYQIRPRLALKLFVSSQPVASFCVEAPTEILTQRTQMPPTSSLRLGVCCYGYGVRLEIGMEKQYNGLIQELGKPL